MKENENKTIYVSTVIGINLIHTSVTERILAVSHSADTILKLINDELSEAIDTFETQLVNDGMVGEAILLEIINDDKDAPCKLSKIGQVASLTSTTSGVTYVLRTEALQLDELNMIQNETCPHDESPSGDFIDRIMSGMFDGDGTPPLPISPESDLGKFLSEMAGNILR